MESYLWIENDERLLKEALENNDLDLAFHLHLKIAESYTFVVLLDLRGGRPFLAQCNSAKAQTHMIAADKINHGEE